MLIVTRKPHEHVMVGDDVVVTLVEIANGRARIGFSAPKEITILRDNVYDRIQRTERPDLPTVHDHLRRFGLCYRDLRQPEPGRNGV